MSSSCCCFLSSSSFCADNRRSFFHDDANGMGLDMSLGKTFLAVYSNMILDANKIKSKVTTVYMPTSPKPVSPTGTFHPGWNCTVMAVVVEKFIIVK